MMNKPFYIFILLHALLISACGSSGIEGKENETARHPMPPGIKLTLFLDDDLSQAEIDSLLQELKKRDFVDELTFISADEALEELKETIGDEIDEVLDVNPLYSSIEIMLKPDIRDRQEIDRIIADFNADPRIVEAIADRPLGR